MCPSFLATREEKDSTRGRARVLQEAIRGARPDWRSPEVHSALDLCLSCKACGSDCPTGVDMATYKSEVLHQSYKGRLRPRSHYSLGRLPLWSRMASIAPRLINAILAAPVLRRPMLLLLGIDRRRSLPRFATKTLHGSASSRPRVEGKPVIVFADSFTSHFSPEAGIAMLDVLGAAGFAPQLSSRSGCCGLTWITTGQLDTARRMLGRTVANLAESARAGIPIVGIEPSCSAVLRQDAVYQLGSFDARAVAAATVTLSELLTSSGWTPPDLSGRSVVAQPHCHHHAVMGWETDEALLRGAGADVVRATGCCGLAGNFGVEIGHYDVSVAVAEHALLPAVDAADEDTPILADGFSCRVQLDDLRKVRGRHLAEFLRDAAGLPGNRR
jgi:Fe-S oxidoreductase